MEKAEPDQMKIEAIMVKLPKYLTLRPCIVLHLEVDRQYRLFYRLDDFPSDDVNTAMAIIG